MTSEGLALTIPMRDLTKDLHMTVTIKGMQAFKWRLKACTLLIKLAAWVAGFGVTVKQNIEIESKIEHK